MTQQTNAQRLADALAKQWNELDPVDPFRRDIGEASEELRRLDAVEKIADDLQDLCDKQALKLAATEAERDQLRAQVERLQGGEPVAWRVRRHDAPKYWIVFLHKPVDALQDPDREVQPLYTPAAPSQEPYKDSTPHLSVGESSFESWFSAYNPANKGDKQRARDAYAAGMADPLVAAVPSQPVTLTEEVFGPIVKAAFDAGWAACRASELVGDNAKEFAWDMSGDEITERLIAALRENEALR